MHPRFLANFDCFFLCVNDVVLNDPGGGITHRVLPASAVACEIDLSPGHGKG